MRRVTCLVALAAAVALALPSGGRATVMQAARPVPDFNNDGFGDLAVGAPGEDVGRRRPDAGAISVLYGRANGMRSNRRWITQNTPGVPGFAEAGDQFGGALVAGKFNRDAYWDLAVGAPYEDVGRAGNAGAVTILFGSGTGLGGGARARLLTQRNPEPGDLFGFSLAVGEIIAPAGAELAVGAPGETVGRARRAGAVSVISRPGIAPTHKALYQGIRGGTGEPGVPGVPEAGDLFGWAIAADDFMPSSGVDSLAVGAPGEDVGAAVDAGVVIVRYAASSSGRRVLRQNRPERGDRFGTALGDGFLTRSDGTEDLAVGAPGETIGNARRAGAVSVFETNNSGFLPRGSRNFYQGVAGVPGMAEAGDRFGAAVAVGGYSRGLGGVALGVGGLAVGVPGENLKSVPDAGVLTLLYRLGGARQEQFTQKQAGGQVEAGDRFGEALWAPFHLNPGLNEGLGVGSPGETVHGHAGAGAFSVLVGAANGGGLPTGQTFYQGPRSRPYLTVGGTPEAGDAVGAAFSGRPGAPARPGRRTPPPPPV
jgi:hypothetical protein